MMDTLLTVLELAERLRISRRSLDRLTAQGQIPVRFVGRAKRYLWTDVLAALPPASVGPRVASLTSARAPLLPDLTARLKQKAAHWPRMIQGGKP